MAYITFPGTVTASVVSLGREKRSRQIKRSIGRRCCRRCGDPLRCTLPVWPDQTNWARLAVRISGMLV